MKEERTESDTTSQPSGQFDIVSKRIVRQYPDECIQFCLGISDAKAIKVLETEQPVVKWFRADSFIHANVSGEEAIIHLEFQTHDSTDVPMPKRMSGYAGLAIRMYELPIYSHVIYLHPDAGQRDPGEYIQDTSGYEITIKYKVIRLCDVDGQSVLDAKLEGLIPFAPLMKPRKNTETKEWLRECVRVANTLPMDEPDRPDYLSNLAILSGLLTNYQTIRDIISEETMHESSVIQHFREQGVKQGIEQGIEQGEIKGTLEALLVALEGRFQSSEVQELRPTLEDIKELQTLKHLHSVAVQVGSLDEFRRILSSDGEK